MVGRVIGKNGETVKAIQTYTGATIQIDQTTDPTRVSLSGAPYSLSLAVSMVTDIVRGSFKGFALLRQATRPANGRASFPSFTEPRPVYAPGYGLIPASQLYDDRTAALNPYGGRGLSDQLQLQQMYPVMAAGGLPQSILAYMPGAQYPAGQQGGAFMSGSPTEQMGLQSDVSGLSQQQQGAASLVSAQLQQLSGLHSGLQPGGNMLYQDQGLLPMGGSNTEEYAVSAGHRLIQAAGNRGAAMGKSKLWMG